MASGHSVSVTSSRGEIRRLNRRPSEALRLGEAASEVVLRTPRLTRSESKPVPRGSGHEVRRSKQQHWELAKGSLRATRGEESRMSSSVSLRRPPVG